MRTISVLPIALLLAGCDSMVQMNAQSNAARVQVAALQSQAQVGAEWARTQAAASVAQSQAMSEVARTVAWSSQLPWVVGLACLTVIIVAVLYWRGRVAVGIGQNSVTHVLPPPQQWRAMQDFARQNGGQLVESPDGRVFVHLPDGQRKPLRITAK